MDLLELQKQVDRKKELDRDLPILCEKREALQREANRLKEQLGYEEEDVTRLESRTLYSLFFTLLGKKDEMLERELTEAEDAKAAYEAVAALLADTNATLSRMEHEANRLRNVEASYQRAIRESLASALQSEADPQKAESLLRLQTEYTRLEKNEALLKEAISEGKIAIQRAGFVMEALEEALTYHRADLEFAKYERLDEAQDRVTAFQIQVKRFCELIPELDIRVDLQVTSHGIDRFLDIIIGEGSNPHYPSRCRRAMYQTDDVAKYVRAAVANLEEKLEEYQTRRISTYKRIQELLNG